MDPILDKLDGNKTYLALVGLFVLWLGWVFQLWTLDQVKELLALNGIFLGLATRSALKKIEVE